MSLRDENQSAGVVLAAVSLVMLLAVAGALFLPQGVVSALFGGKRALLVLALATFVAVPLLLWVAQRNRVRRAVEELGGQLVQLRRLPLWRQGDWPESYQQSLYGDPWWRGVLFDVEFTDLLGATHRAICRSGFLRGVQWLEEQPHV